MPGILQDPGVLEREAYTAWLLLGRLVYRTGGAYFAEPLYFRNMPIPRLPPSLSQAVPQGKLAGIRGKRLQAERCPEPPPQGKQAHRLKKRRNTRTKSLSNSAPEGKNEPPLVPFLSVSPQKTSFLGDFKQKRPYFKRF